MTKRRHEMLVALLILYTMVIIYFMFFGFSRPQIDTSITEYRFSIILTGIPLWFPKNLSFLWFFSLGNLVAFTPFGILIPEIFDIKYPKFIINFLIFIILLEFLQMVTYLGSFDIEDIIVNSIGVTIGFVSYKLSKNFNSAIQKTTFILISIFILSFAMIVFAEIFNKII